MKIENKQQLRDVYNQPGERAIRKQLSQLDEHCINFIHHAPFAVISTVNQNLEADASPRGGNNGFIKVKDANTILIPDSSGNNRLDSLNNILDTGSIGLLFMIPGIKETLRVNGKATITTSKEYLNLFDDDFKAPKACIEVKVKEAFLHCAKAFMRSNLWQPENWKDTYSFPTMGQMLKDQLGGNEPPESRKDMENRYKKDL